MQDEGPEAAEIRNDRLARLGMHAHLARQGKKLEGLFQRDVLGLLALGDRGALRLLAFHRLAELQIGPEAARAALRTLTDKWDAIGKVPKERSGELDRRLRAVEKKVRDAGDSARVDPEALARAEQFRTRAEQFERQAEKAAAAGRTKESEEAKANATQWREWADAAAKAVAHKR